MYLVHNRVQKKINVFALSNINPRLIKILLLYRDKRSTKKKTALCYKQCINLNPRMNIYMQLTLQIEMLTKTLFPVVCDSRSMRRYVYLFLNRKPREKQNIQLEPNHKNF